jgi:GT2 family glycosyltransferase
MTPGIGVAIAAFERPNLTIAAVEAALANGCHPSAIVVADGGSSPQTVSSLRERLPAIRLIASEGPRWWAEAMNVAVRALLQDGVPYVLFLNQDCEPQPGCLDHLRRALVQGAEVAASVVVIRERPDALLDAGARWSRHRRLPFVRVVEPLYPRGTRIRELPSEPYETDIVTGRGVLFGAGVLFSHGLLNARAFPQRGGDDDLSLRLRRAGVQLRVAPRALTATGEADCGAERASGAFMRDLAFRMFDPRGGSAVTVAWRQCVRHCSITELVPTYMHRLITTAVAAWRLHASSSRP